LRVRLSKVLDEKRHNHNELVGLFAIAEHADHHVVFISEQDVLSFSHH
jgi:hypothetical protein